LLNKNTPHLELGNDLIAKGNQVILVDYQPSCENMIVDIANKIITLLPKDVELHSLKLRETETSFAEWYACDNI
jgi:6-pyruvoyltetrahydropterin/6-carboxytetrahydropterin synthase